MKTVSAAFALVLCLGAVSGPVRAETVGVASEVVRPVLESTGADFAPLAEGETLFRDQRIRSGRDGSAILTLEDASVVAVGPSSEVVLDAFVAPGGARGVSVARGVFRFISGPAGSGTHYIVRTPHASIAVRGTRFDVRVLDGMTTVVLDEGAVDVCVRGTCQAVSPGTAVDVTRAGIYPAVTDQSRRWTFLTGAGPAQRKLALDADGAASRARAAFAAASPRPPERRGGGEGSGRGSFDTAAAGSGAVSSSGAAAGQAGGGETTSAQQGQTGSGDPAGSPGVSLQTKTPAASSGGLSVKMKVQ